ncbi:MAG: class I SAM-dependent methyltransferase [Bacteroidales bacterium]|nr:class I SAM-dependent methyltransferase [Bacteroidales bacterium]
MDFAERHIALIKFLERCPVTDSVYIYAEEHGFSAFEKSYIETRKKENRVYSDEIVAQLPDGSFTSQPDEWKKRKRSAQRVQKYFSKVEEVIILDLGCGNGWFTNVLAKNSQNIFIGMDVNAHELKQATRLFQSPNLCFLHGDIFETPFPLAIFDYVTINAAVQYFPDLGRLIFRLNELLKESGEVHIIDSPFYKGHEIGDARKRTENYYSQVGNVEMADFYFHHSFDELKKFKFDMLYNPDEGKIIKKILGKKDMPFPWIRIKKEIN